MSKTKLGKTNKIETKSKLSKTPKNKIETKDKILCIKRQLEKEIPGFRSWWSEDDKYQVIEVMLVAKNKWDKENANFMNSITKIIELTKGNTNNAISLLEHLGNIASTPEDPSRFKRAKDIILAASTVLTASKKLVNKSKK